jgi:cytidyltransferase-like protein
MKEKRLLGAVFTLTLEGRGSGVADVAERLGAGAAEARTWIRACEKRGLLEVSRGRLSLTQRGRRRIRVVFMGGGFEVIHRGHLHTISEARRLGDVLVVTVARDSTIRARKNREPVSDEVQRMKLLASLRQVDSAILGVEGNIYETLERVGPDVVVLGYDQHHLEADIAREGAARGLKLKVVRLDSPDPALKTSALLRDL